MFTDMSVMTLLLIILVAGSIIGCSIQYFMFWLHKGDFEDPKTTFSKTFSFNKTLNKKMKYYYNKDVTWLKMFMNFFLPLYTLASIYGVINMLISGDYTPLYLIGAIVMAVVSLATAALIRFIDSAAFIMTVVWSVCFMLYLFSSMGFDGFLVITAVIWSIFPICNIVYFAKRRELFQKSVKELKELYKM